MDQFNFDDSELSFTDDDLAELLPADGEQTLEQRALMMINRARSAQKEIMARENKYRPIIRDMLIQGASIPEIQKELLNTHGIYLIQTIDHVFDLVPKEAVVSVKLDADGLLHTDNDEPALVLIRMHDGATERLWQRHGLYYARENGEANYQTEDGQSWYESTSVVDRGATIPVHTLHRENGPAMVITAPIKSELWMLHGKEHRIGGPSFSEDDRSFRWTQHGVPTRAEGLPTMLIQDKEGNTLMQERKRLKPGKSMDDPRPAYQEFLKLNLFAQVGMTEEEARKWQQRIADEDPIEYHSENDIPSFRDPHTGTFWHDNGKLHRDGDKPAWVGPDGTEAYYYHGLPHRANGPAITGGQQQDSYWLFGKQVQEDEL